MFQQTVFETVTSVTPLALVHWNWKKTVEFYWLVTIQVNKLWKKITPLRQEMTEIWKLKLRSDSQIGKKQLMHYASPGSQKWKITLPQIDNTIPRKMWWISGFLKNARARSRDRVGSPPPCPIGLESTYTSTSLVEWIPMYTVLPSHFTYLH